MGSDECRTGEAKQDESKPVIDIGSIIAAGEALNALAPTDTNIRTMVEAGEYLHKLFYYLMRDSESVVNREDFVSDRYDRTMSAKGRQVRNNPGGSWRPDPNNKLEAWYYNEMGAQGTYLDVWELLGRLHSTVKEMAQVFLDELDHSGRLEAWNAYERELACRCQKLWCQLRDRNIYDW